MEKKIFNHLIAFNIKEFGKEFMFHFISFCSFVLGTKMIIKLTFIFMNESKKIDKNNTTVKNKNFCKHKLTNIFIFIIERERKSISTEKERKKGQKKSSKKSDRT